MQTTRGTSTSAKVSFCAEHAWERGAAFAAPLRRPDGTVVKRGKGRPRKTGERTSGEASAAPPGGTKRGLAAATPVETPVETPVAAASASPVETPAEVASVSPVAEVSKRARTEASGEQLQANPAENEALAPASQGAAEGAPLPQAGDLTSSVTVPEEANGAIAEVIVSA